jgi:uncharacterized protein (TIGR00369 family)
MEFPVVIPFVQQLGFELLRFEGGEAELAVDLRPQLTNSFAVAHGGVTMTLLDVAMAHAARSPTEAGAEQQPGVVTIEMKTSFLRPGEGRLTARARLLHRTASMAFCEGSVLDAAGQLVAHATGTFKYVRAMAGRDRRITRLQRADGSD